MPSAAQTRWRIGAAPSRPLPANAPGFPSFDVSLLRHRGGIAEFDAQVEWDRDQRSFRDDGMGQFMDREAAVADEDDLTTWPPARPLQCALPGPVCQQFVTTTALTVRSLRRREPHQDRQRLDQAGP